MSELRQAAAEMLDAWDSNGVGLSHFARLRSALLADKDARDARHNAVAVTQDTLLSITTSLLSGRENLTSRDIQDAVRTADCVIRAVERYSPDAGLDANGRPHIGEAVCSLGETDADE